MTYTKEYRSDQRHLLANDVVGLCLQGRQFTVAPIPAHRDGRLVATGVLRLTAVSSTDPWHGPSAPAPTAV